MGAAAKDRRLIDRRQKAVQVHRLPAFKRSRRIGHDDIPRQRLAFRTQAINNP